MFQSSVISNHHRVYNENFGLPLNALNGSDQNFDNRPPSYEDAISPPLFSPISFTNHNSSLFSSPTHHRQKSNSVSPISSPTLERQIGGRTYGVQTLADTYHVTNNDDISQQTMHFFGDHLGPDSNHFDGLPSYENVIHSTDIFRHSPAHLSWEDERIPPPIVRITDTSSVGPGSIRVISQSSSTVELSSEVSTVQLQENQPIRKKRIRHMICGITAVMTAIAVPTLIFFLTSLRNEDKNGNRDNVINTTTTTTSVPSSASKIGKSSTRQRKYICWPSWPGKKTNTNMNSKDDVASKKD